MLRRWQVDLAMPSPMLHVPEPNAYVHTVNYGSIGLGMGNAIGASFGAPRRPVADSSPATAASCSVASLSSTPRCDTTSTSSWSLLNDGAYGAEHIQFRNTGMDPTISTFDWPDFGPIATALGGEGYTVRNLDQPRVRLWRPSRAARGPCSSTSRSIPRRSRWQGTDARIARIAVYGTPSAHGPAESRSAI